MAFAIIGICLPLEQLPLPPPDRRSAISVLCSRYRPVLGGAGSWCNGDISTTIRLTLALNLRIS